MSEFRFDPLSFLIGLGSASGLAVVLYRLRHQIGRMRQQARARAESARQFATRTADVRYQIDVRNYAEQYHAAGNLTALSDVLIEPRFIIGMKPYDVTGEAKMQNVFHVIPMLHRFPAAYSRFNIKTIGIEDLGASDRHLALLGKPGSGRSTALAAIALWALGSIDFDQVEDVVQRAIEEEEATLDDKDRAVRRKEREDIQARALEQIAHAQEEASAALTDDVQTHRDIVDLHQLMPILVHFSDIVIDPAFAGRMDPAEPLVQAIQQNIRRISAFTVPRYVYNRLNSGQALVLLDGLDDLPQSEQDSRLAWLRQFLEVYPHCTVIVAGPATGYYPLAQLGLTTMFLRPWMPRDVKRMTEKWSAAWPAAAGTRRQPAEQPYETTVNMIAERSATSNPMDIVTRIFATFNQEQDEIEQLTRWDWYSEFATKHFTLRAFAGNDDLADSALFAVAELAAQMLEAGPMPLSTIREILSVTLEKSNAADQKGSKRNSTLDIEQFIKMLTGTSGLLVKRFGERYEFAHPLVGAFLASATLLDPESERSLVSVVDAPEWRTALTFAVAQAPVDVVNKAVVNSLTRQPDLLFQNIMTLSDWMPFTPTDSPWRGEVFKRLAAALIAPAQFPVLREWSMAALVATNDPNARMILRQATRSTDIHIRTLGCIGLGAFGSSEAIRDLRSMLEDEAMDVQLAAALALGAIGTERAVEVMLDGLYAGEENLRQAVAEALAALPEYGHLILHEATTHEDMMVRRASVFGLARIGTPWALTDLYRRLLEDDQWYVRSAAEQVFATARPEVKETALAHPPLDEMEWITEWLQEHRITLEPDQDMEQVLVRMLRDGDQAYRVAAARTLGRLGYLPALNALYVIMADDNEAVRSASFAALADLEAQYALPLPAVV